MNFKPFSIALEGFFYWINIEKSLRLSQYQGLKLVGELMEIKGKFNRTSPERQVVRGITL